MRPCLTQSQTFSSPIRTESNQWSEQMNSLHEQVNSNITSVSANTANDDSGSNYSDFITRQLHFESDSGAPVNFLTSYLEAASNDAVTTDEKGKSKELPMNDIQNFDDKSSDIKHVKANTNVQRNIELSRTDRNHMITDLVMMAKTAFNLHASQRDWIKVSALKESIMYESDIRSKLNAKYKASTNTTLDGNKAFAKEIIARHSVDEIQEWESGDYFPWCILSA